MAHEAFVHQKAFRQIAEVEILHGPQQFAQPQRQAIDVGRFEREEVGLVHLVGIFALDLADNQLQRAVVELGRAFDTQKIAVVETAVELLVGIPHHGGQRAATVRQAQLQIEIAVAIGAQLLVGGEKHFVDGFVFTQLTDEPAWHGLAFLAQGFVWETGDSK